MKVSNRDFVICVVFYSQFFFVLMQPLLLCLLLSTGFDGARNNKSIVSNDDLKENNFGVAASSEFADASLYNQSLIVVTFEGDINVLTLEYNRAEKLRIQQAYTFPRCLQKDNAAYNASCLEMSQITPIMYYTDEDDVKEFSKASLEDVAFIYEDSYLEEMKLCMMNLLREYLERNLVTTENQIAVLICVGNMSYYANHLKIINEHDFHKKTSS